MFANISIAEFDPEIAQAIASKVSVKKLISNLLHLKTIALSSDGSTRIKTDQQICRRLSLANATMAVVNMLMS